MQVKIRIKEINEKISIFIIYSEKGILLSLGFMHFAVDRILSVDSREDSHM